MELQGVESMPDATLHRRTRIWIRSLLETVSRLQRAKAYRKARGGKPNPLAVSVRLLMMLEYGTYLHIDHNYSVSESTAYRTVRWCGDVLIKGGGFTRPGKHALLKHERAYEVVLIDATETPVECPPTNSAGTTRVRINTTP